MEFDPRAQWDSTRGIRLFNRLLTQWDSTRGPSGIRLFNRLLTHRDSTRGPSGIRLLHRVLTKWDSTRGPRAIRPEGPVGLGPRSRAIRPRKRADPPTEPHRPNRLFSRLFDHASHRPVDVEPRCPHRTRPVECGRVRAKWHRPLNRLLNRQNRLLNALLEQCGPKRRAPPLEGPLWPLFCRTLARVGPIGNRTLARIKFPLARTPRYWFARAPRARYWLMRAVREWPCTRGG